MSLSAAEQDTWDTLKGITNPEIKEYSLKHPEKMNKYLKMQRALNHKSVSFQPVQAIRKGPGFAFDKWEDGVEELVKFMPLRRKAIAKAMADIEKKLGEKVYFSKMTFVYKITYTRYQADIVLGADVLIEGCANQAGTVNYFYDNARAAEGAHRFVIVNGKKDTI